MKLTDQQLAELKALKMPAWLARKDDAWAHKVDTAISALLADLEEARAELATTRKQLATAYERCAVTAWNHFMDTCKQQNIHPSNIDEYCSAAAIRSLKDTVQLSSEYLTELQEARKQLAEAQAREAAMRQSVRNWIEANDPEGFGCACTPDHTCGTCKWATRVSSLETATAQSTNTSALQSAIAEAVEPYKRDAERFRETLMHIGASSTSGSPCFTLNIRALRSVFKGSVAQHFTKAIDDLLSAQEKP